MKRGTFITAKLITTCARCTSCYSFWIPVCFHFLLFNVVIRKVTRSRVEKSPPPLRYRFHRMRKPADRPDHNDELCERVGFTVEFAPNRFRLPATVTLSRPIPADAFTDKRRALEDRQVHSYPSAFLLRHKSTDKYARLTEDGVWPRIVSGSSTRPDAADVPDTARYFDWTTPRHVTSALLFPRARCIRLRDFEFSVRNLVIFVLN